MGVVKPHRMRKCSESIRDTLYEKRDGLVNQKKDFTPNLNELKREAPNDFGYMLPKYKTIRNS